MRKIYKLSFLVLISFVVLNAYAQDFTWGVDVGMNLSDAHVKDYNGRIKSKIGWQAGLAAEYALTDAFSLQSGLYFTSKGFKNKFDFFGTSESYKERTSINQNYLQIPLKAAYKIGIVDNAKFGINFGSYFAAGVGGKTKVKINDWVGTIEETVEDGKVDTFGKDYLKRFDFGLAFGAAVEFDCIVVGLNYELGLLNVARNGQDIKNRNASLTVGFRF